MKLLNLLLYFFIISILTPSVEAEMIPCPRGKEEMRRDGPRVNIKVTSDQNQTYTIWWHDSSRRQHSRTWGSKNKYCALSSLVMLVSV